MLDIKFIRENKDIVSAGARKKHVDFDVEALLVLDDKRKALQASVEAKKAKQNEVSTKIPTASAEERQSLINEMQIVKAEFQKEDEVLKELMKEWHGLMIQVPNIPDMSVPEGAGEEENKVVHEWGVKPVFDFEPKNHIDLMLSLDMVDFERGTKTHGFRGYFLKGDGAELSWAVWNYARDFFGKKRFTPFIAPAVIKKEFFYGTGHLPKEADDLFKTQDEDYLSGTSEVPMMAYHGDEIMKASDLPKRYFAFSPCYRREAGSHGKDTNGLIRVHEFYKLEQLILCKADHAESDAFFEEINRNYEEFIESLNMAYHRLLICGGDLGMSKVKQYDTEVWFPSQNAYREGSSASYFHDFQTRRFNIRYDDGEKKRYVHSLNCTAAATPRLLAAIVENYQNKDGTITIPEVLRQYMGGRDIISLKS
jgi:seryl-tRNA synthetase